MGEQQENNPFDEVAAAEAELSAAQARLAAARRRAAQAQHRGVARGEAASSDGACSRSQAGGRPQSQQPSSQQPQSSYSAPAYVSAIGAKDHVAAGLLAILLGWLGVHKFYLGYYNAAFIMLGVSILGGIVTATLAAGAIWIISIIEGVIYLTKSQTEFEQMYVANKREWF